MTESALKIANRFKEVFLNGHWVVGSNYKAQLSGVTWEQATKKISDLNTIAALIFHVHYYISGILQVLEGGKLEIKDQFSFDAPPINGQEDWENRLKKYWADAEKFAFIVEQMTEEQLDADFSDQKYGSIQRNIEAMIEHGYYHLG